MEFEIVSNMLVKFSSSDHDAYIIMSVVDTCLCIDSYGYKDDYLRENNYEDQHLDLIIGAVYRVFEEWNFNQIFFMSYAEVKEVLQIAKFMLRADTHAIQNLQTISGYSHLEMSHTFDTLERAFSSFPPIPRAHGPLQFQIKSSDTVCIDMNGGDFSIFHGFFHYSFTHLFENFIQYYGYNESLKDLIKKIRQRIWLEFEATLLFKLSRFEIEIVLQALQFIFISERSHAFSSTYKNHVISIIEGLQHAQLELE
jgi:hypothetical protein